MRTDDNPVGAPREDIEKILESLKDDLPRRAAQAAPDFFGVPKNSLSRPKPSTGGAGCSWTVVSSRCCSDLWRLKDGTETDFRAAAANDPDTYTNPARRHRQVGARWN